MQVQERVTDGQYINTQFVAARVVYRCTKMKIRSTCPTFKMTVKKPVNDGP